MPARTCGIGQDSAALRSPCRNRGPSDRNGHSAVPCWPSRRAVVLNVAADCGLSGAAFEARLAAIDVLDTIRQNTDELVSRMGFGSPTMFLGDDMYFGHDRMPLLESALMRAIDRPFIAPGEHDR